MKKIHHWKNKPLHLKVAITQHPLFIACKKSPLSVGIIIVLLVFFSAKVFAQPETHQEVGIERPEIVKINPIKATKPKTVQLATMKAAEPQTAPNYASGDSVWDRLAECESGGNWAINSGNGFYGGLQFDLQTWQSNGGEGYPHENSREEQIRVAERLRANRGYSPWPSCSSQLGLS